MTTNINPNVLTEVWDAHLRSEFAEKDTEATLRTMTATPRVNVVPLMVGASNLDEMREFYSRHFLNQLPPDIETVPISRTVGQNRVVDEMVLRFTHSVQMDWILPGVPPTNRRIEVPMVAIIQFEDGKVAQENLYWDMGTVMLQAGLIDGSLPVRGADCARQMLDPVLPMNELIQRAQR
ncbi:nuclear transport factor 2 family protein [Polyangium sp. 6x1]|uniref:nuclear transport factor 2 family protein n=1 Tax=Polyangium sp. 6x1 TaxID=3042689 RepID=UPI002482E593|nr:nuclear transport factor 2 family protein [Polyangium sp. 6x1]MDI1443659.1 nuclear transport factor 2 family protein [Polyangium sp. 6x1]